MNTEYKRVQDIEVGDVVFYNQVYCSRPVTITRIEDLVETSTLYYHNDQNQEQGWNDHKMTLLPVKE